MIFSQNYIVEEILNLCRISSYQDVTIICQNGSFQSNSFLLAALFPIFRDIFNTSGQYEQSYVISMPDMDKNCLESVPLRFLLVPPWLHGVWERHILSSQNILNNFYKWICGHCTGRTKGNGSSQTDLETIL